MQIIHGKKKKNVWSIPIEPEEFEAKPLDKIIATFDTETDPFAQGLIVAPFCCGFYIPSIDFYIDFWGDNCIDQFFMWLRQVTSPKGKFAGWEFIICTHNGGNFDFYFMLEYFDSGHKPFIINGRLVRIMMQGQEFRDSYTMIPFALEQYHKTKIDYDKFTRANRETHKDEIRAYQKDDCRDLADLVTGWFDLFGNRLTIASAGMAYLRSFHGFETLHEKLDTELRPFYFGGRTQCFATGIHHGNFRLYDINSSYLNVMRSYQHPISDTPTYETRITARTHFAYIKAWSLGALPVRKKDGGLDFPMGTHDFYACIHEIRAGLETGTLQIIKVHYSLYFEAESNFAEFVDFMYEKKETAAKLGNAVDKLLYKYGGNAPYGKFAQDPRRYENWLFNPDQPPTPEYCERCNTLGYVADNCDSCQLKETSPYGWYAHTTQLNFTVYAQPQKIRATSFYNVATAASITSAARAELLRALQAAKRPLYCDTDSIICEGFDDAKAAAIRIHPTDLGAWDIEAQGDTIAIAAKKLYALFDAGKEVKKASKGVRLTADEIFRVAEGEVIEYANPVPKFHLDGTADFVTRTIRRN